ncbi:unnamed protein product [Somion occarium]|uniref:F-box domain-containing protein n=1 Tax=Somion occarium TaxID=3059160 RepID=A0ABP1CSJ6_9APHY
MDTRQIQLGEYTWSTVDSADLANMITGPGTMLRGRSSFSSFSRLDIFIHAHVFWQSRHVDLTFACNLPRARGSGTMDTSVASPSFRLPPHVSQLPPELLTKIFLHLADACRHQARAMDYYDSSGYGPYAWLPVTCVCHFWHDAALRCPSLWAFIDVSYPLEHVKMLLARSGKVPLIVKPTHRSDDAGSKQVQPDQVVLALVLQELPRIVKLEVEIMASLGTKLEAMVQRPAPMLRSLCIKKLSIFEDDPLNEQKKRFALRFDVPLLRSLKIVDLKFSEAKTLFRSSLRKLVLEATEYPPLREVLDCIRELPLLSSLELRAFDYFYDSDTDYPEDYEPVALNHLQWLHIKGSQHYSQFLDNLEVRPGVSVFFEMTTEDMFVEVEDIDTMTYRAATLSGLPDYDAELPPSRLLRSVVVEVEQVGEGVVMDIRGWDVVFPHDVFALAIEDPSSFPRPFLHLNLESFFVNDDVEALSYFCRHIDFEELQALILVFSRRRDVDKGMGHGLADIFDSPSIGTLIVPDWQVGHLAALITTGDCDVSIRSPDDPLPSRIPPIPFPGLKTLVTYRLRWTTDDDGIRTSRLPLATALKYRAKNNVGIETLLLHNCLNIDSEDLGESTVVVPNFVWEVWGASRR